VLLQKKKGKPRALILKHFLLLECIGEIIFFSLSDRDRKQPEVVSSRKRKLKNAPRRDQG